MTGARPFLDADFPGYAEAVARENVIRGAACLGINEKICGLEVKPLTAYHVRYLTLIRSPFLLAVTAKDLATRPGIDGDVMQFLWIVSPMFKPGSATRKNRWHLKTERDQFNDAFSSIVNLKIDAVCAEILQYIEEAYTDAGECGSSNDKSFYAFEVSIANELHEHYGYRIDFWNKMADDENPICVPLKIVFQLRKSRLHKKGELVSNKSENLISLGLARMNEKMKENPHDN